MTRKHTPGPWATHSESRHVAIVSELMPGLSPILAVVDKWPREAVNESNANTRLIAAAPELADALVSVHRELRKSGWDMTQINAALNKAGIPSGEPT